MKQYHAPIRKAVATMGRNATDKIICYYRLMEYPKEHILHPEFDLEGFFTGFVNSVGGQKLDEVFASLKNQKNADYYFPSANVIAELKILSAEYAHTDSFRRRRNELINERIETGILQPNWLTGKSVNPSVDADIRGLLMAPLSDRAKKANKQIRETKRLLSQPDAQGVLIVLNDGFYEIEPLETIRLLENSLSRSMSSIDGFIHLNFRRHLVLNGEKMFFWLKRLRNESNLPLAQFIDQLGLRWWAYLETLSGNQFSNQTFDPDPLNRSLGGAGYKSVEASVFTGFSLNGSNIMGPKDKRGFYIENGRIRGPKNDGLFWIDDGYVCGPLDDHLYWLHENKLYGPDRLPPWFRFEAQ